MSVFNDNGTISLSSKVVRVCGCVTLWENDGYYFEPNYMLKQLLGFFQSYKVCSKYYLIIHQPDKENGLVHIHYLAILTSQRSLSSILNSLTDYLNVPRDMIGVKKNGSISGYLRYLTHIDNDEKIKYKASDIVSNDSYDNILEFIDTQSDEISATRLIDYVLTYPRPSDCMIAMTLPIYHKFRYEIKELREQMRDGLLMKEAFKKNNPKGESKDV